MFKQILNFHNSIVGIFTNDNTEKECVVKIGMIVSILYMWVIQLAYTYSIGLFYTSKICAVSALAQLFMLICHSKKLFNSKILFHSVLLITMSSVHYTYLCVGQALNPTLAWVIFFPILPISMVGFYWGGFYTFSSITLNVVSYSYYEKLSMFTGEWTQGHIFSVMQSNLISAPVLLYIVFVFYLNAKDDLQVEVSHLADKNKKLFNILMHDMANPITSLDFAIFNKNFGRIERSSNKIKEILESAREMAKAADGKFFLEIKSEPINFLEDEIVTFFSGRIKEKDITLHFYCDENTKCFIDKKVFINQVLFNFVSNAIKFSQTNNLIEIQTKVEKKYLNISVHDFGEGIPQDVIDSLFSGKLIQSKRGTANEKGSGFGLDIAYSLIKQMNGKLNISNINGTKIEIYLLIDQQDEFSNFQSLREA